MYLMPYGQFIKDMDISLKFSFQLAWPQLASPTEIPAEPKATPVFLSSSITLIQDSVPKFKIDFFNNHFSDFDKI